MAATPPHVLAEEEEEEAEPKEEEEGNQCAVAAADDLCLTANHPSVSMFPTGYIPISNASNEYVACYARS